MKHPESPRFAGALVGLGIVAVAALAAVGLLLTSPRDGDSAGPVPAVTQKPISKLSNAELIAFLGEPYGAIDCAQTLGVPAGLAGLAWVDDKKGRIVVVCAAE